MTRARRLLVAAAVASLALVSVPRVAPAEGHCASYPVGYQLYPTGLTNPGPVAYLSSGYFGVGGIGAFDGYGCSAGQEVADTRVMHPRADFVVLVLARVACTAQPPETIDTGTIKGFGGFKDLDEEDVQLGCVFQAQSGTYYLSGLFAVPPDGSGRIEASVKVGGVTYTAETRSAA